MAGDFPVIGSWVVFDPTGRDLPSCYVVGRVVNVVWPPDGGTDRLLVVATNGEDGVNTVVETVAAVIEHAPPPGINPGDRVDIEPRSIRVEPGRSYRVNPYRLDPPEAKPIVWSECEYAYAVWRISDYPLDEQERETFWEEWTAELSDRGLVYASSIRPLADLPRVQGEVEDDGTVEDWRTNR